MHPTILPSAGPQRLPDIGRAGIIRYLWIPETGRHLNVT
jgi:hypothetical protein